MDKKQSPSTQHDICAICLEQPRNAKSLPSCTHLFCERCLESYIKGHESQDSVACPTCTVVCPMEEIKADLLGSDMQSATGGGKTVSSENEHCTLCFFKGLETRAGYFCENCDDTLLCSDCATSHKSRLKRHTVRPLSAFVRIAPCQRHGDRPLELLCLECDSVVCEVCVDLDHDGHELGDIRDVTNQLSETYGLLSGASPNISTLKSQLHDIQEQEGSVIAKVEQEAERIREEIYRSRDEIVASIRAHVEGKQIDTQISNLEEAIRDITERGKEIFSEGVSNVAQYHTAVNTKTTWEKATVDASKEMDDLERKLHGVSVPTFIPSKETTPRVVGQLQSSQNNRTSPGKESIIQKAKVCTLMLGGKFQRKPCYKLYNVFVSKQETSTCSKTILSCFEFTTDGTGSCESSGLLLMTPSSLNKISSKTFGFNVVTAVPFNNCTFLVLMNTGSYGQNQMYSRHAYFIHHDGTVTPTSHIKNTRNSDVPLSLAKTKCSNFILLCKEQYGCLIIYLLSQTLSLLKGPIRLPDAITASLGNDYFTMNLCESTADMLLLNCKKLGKVIAMSLKMKHGSSMQFFSHGSMSKLEHYIETEPDLSAPLEGHYIMDICCDGGKVYLCTKKGAPTDQSSEVGPIRFYEATLTSEKKWEFECISLVDPSGKPFTELKKDELVYIGVHTGTFMCMVCSPIPPDELGLSAEPGVNVTWYYGTLPEATH